MYAQRIQEQVMAATAGSTAVAGWVVIANEYLQMAAFIVSIIAGMLAIYAHFKRKKKIDLDP